MIAVLTGGFGADELRDAGAIAVFQSVSDLCAQPRHEHKIPQRSGADRQRSRPRGSDRDLEMNDTQCVSFLQWALPRLGLRRQGFRDVRRQVCKRLRRRLTQSGARRPGRLPHSPRAGSRRAGGAREPDADYALALSPRPARVSRSCGATCCPRSRALARRCAAIEGVERGAAPLGRGGLHARDHLTAPTRPLLPAHDPDPRNRRRRHAARQSPARLLYSRQPQATASALAPSRSRNRGIAAVRHEQAREPKQSCCAQAAHGWMWAIAEAARRLLDP